MHYCRRKTEETDLEQEIYQKIVQEKKGRGIIDAFKKTSVSSIGVSEQIQRR